MDSSTKYTELVMSVTCLPHKRFPKFFGDTLTSPNEAPLYFFLENLIFTEYFQFNIRVSLKVSLTSKNVSW